MKRLITTAMLVLIFVSQEAFATTIDNVWYKDKVKSVYPLGDGDFIVIFEKENSCTGTYFYIEEGINGVTEKAMPNYLSVVLTAAASGKALSVYYDKNDPKCHVNRLLVDF